MSNEKTADFHFYVKTAVSFCIFPFLLFRQMNLTGSLDGLFFLYAIFLSIIFYPIYIFQKTLYRSKICFRVFLMRLRMASPFYNQ